MMLFLMDTWDSVRGFISTGGDVLLLVAFVLFLMWVLMLERYFYLNIAFPRFRKNMIAQWDARDETSSWHAHRIREAWISQAKQQLNARMLIIKTLVAICPMIGLLGTVTGMINVFDVMAVQGTSNARAMAAGISTATMPTMAGMVAALSGVFFSTRLDARLKVSLEKLADSLSYKE
ncbi:MotA/TolQ/ExbB proton channel family protein [Paraferrimonas haliotis]|uniref:TonB2 energy transduction system inner membrane component ExbB n=1 Tax=Paraferrimonas haliotis TaxID=2013866 RepID=A0AA37WX10_9GAMM|nr:MotA/TolQ/ExbB proton channel family protein [Paraferrimonas haliotis]GLS83876.1 TonB2 energy transduction system inner membrane component ExbB [Paraferrimonas haliotis]GLS84003.1 TonB2 energy transduction system inner membrane component ExbB [Paraferrimonas haliotis]